MVKHTDIVKTINAKCIFVQKTLVQTAQQQN